MFVFIVYRTSEAITQLSWILRHEVSFALSPSVDRAGGLICYWNLSSFQEEARVYQPRFVAIKGSWVARDGPEGIICLYAPMDHS